jgi:transposase
VIDVEPLIREELERRVPRVDPAIASWPDILRRSGETKRRRRRRLAAAMVTGGAVVALAVSPLGGAVTRAVGAFSDWLHGTPGAPTSSAVQQRFDAANFPGSPRLRELLHVTLDGHLFVLYGFATRQVVCLRLALKALGTGPQTACASRADLRRSRDLVVVPKHVGSSASPWRLRAAKRSVRRRTRMKLHGNAALSWSGRRRLVLRIVDEGWTLTRAAEAAGVSVRCARKWVGRYRDAGERGLCDRSSAPRHVANRTPDDRVAAIVALRRLRMTAAEIAELLSMPLSTVSAVLSRSGMGRLGRIGLEQPVRYERRRPGELVHVDVKKLGRIQGGAGKRVRGGSGSVRFSV